MVFGSSKKSRIRGGSISHPQLLESIEDRSERYNVYYGDLASTRSGSAKSTRSAPARQMRPGWSPQQQVFSPGSPPWASPSRWNPSAGSRSEQDREETLYDDYAEDYEEEAPRHRRRPSESRHRRQPSATESQTSDRRRDERRPQNPPRIPLSERSTGKIDARRSERAGSESPSLNKKPSVPRLKKKPAVEEVDDGSKRWITRSSEPLAMVRLTTLQKSVAEDSESLFTAINTFTLDLAVADQRHDAQAYLERAAKAISKLPKLTDLRIIGPRDTRITLPASISLAIEESGCIITALTLTRIASFEDPHTVARIVGKTCSSLKLNDCKLATWRPMLRHCTRLDALEALVPPEGLSWLTRSQWQRLGSLRIGYGTEEVLQDVLESATAYEGESVYRTNLHTLVISHFTPLSLDTIVRFARTLGTPTVKKLEISRISAEVFEPKLLISLAAYFEDVEDLRIHSAEVDEETLSVSEGRKVRTRAVDWTSGRFGMDDYGEAFEAFQLLRTVEVNHSRYPFLVSSTPSSTSEPDASTIPKVPDGSGRNVSDLMLVDAKHLATTIPTLKRVSYSYSINSHFLDVQITRDRRNASYGSGVTVKDHWTRPGKE